VRSEDETRPAVTTSFGVSGYLIESDVLIWDRETQSLWSQTDGIAIAGPLAGSELEHLPVVDTTWGEWRKRHPKTKVLKGPGNAKRYGRGAYGNYRVGDKVMFPLSNRSDRLKTRAIVTGVRLGGASACWSHDEMAERAGKRDAKERDEPLEFDGAVGDHKVRLRFDPAGDSLEVFDVAADGERTPLAAMRCYWFAWFTFQPRTTVDGKPVDPRTMSNPPK